MKSRFASSYARYSKETTVFNRARDFYLYTQHGIRFIDVDLAQARAVFGYKMPGLGARIKQNVDKGILHDVPTAWQHRVEKHCAMLFPTHRYAGIYTPIQATSEMLHTVCDAGESYNLWRPFAGALSVELLPLAQSFFVPLPIAWDPPLYVLLIPCDIPPPRVIDCLCTVDMLTQEKMLLTRTRISPVLYATVCMALSTLYAHRYQTSENGKNTMLSYANRKFPNEHKNKKNIYAITHEENALHTISARAEKLPLPSMWKQHGIYITMSAIDDEYYVRIRNAFWMQGFVMPPSHHGLLTLPYFFTKRELKNWQNAVTVL